MKKRVLFFHFILIVVFTAFTSSCDKAELEDEEMGDVSTVTDIDGNVYRTITIGNQIWMAENLKTTKYRNGDPIPNVTDKTQWIALNTGAMCNYDNNEVIGNKYGKLYNWFAVSDKRNIAPTGWHVPSIEEWETLRTFVNANLGQSGSEGKALASKTDWIQSNELNAVGNDLTKNNSSGFTALPGGARTQNFQDIGAGGYWWSTDEYYNAGYNEIHIKGRYLYSNLSQFPYEPKGNNFTKISGLSIRCIKD